MEEPAFKNKALDQFSLGNGHGGKRRREALASLKEQ
jgi:hypothetical protein